MGGKRKAKAEPSSPPAARKRGAVAQVNFLNNPFGSDEEDGEEETQDIRAISVLAKRWSKEDAFFSEMREKVAIDQTELERLCNEAKDELAENNRTYHTRLDAIITSALSTCYNADPLGLHADWKHRHGIAEDSTTEDTKVPSDFHPDHAHALLLFERSESLLDRWERADHAVTQFKGLHELQEKRKEENDQVARLLLVGAEVAKRNVDGLLQKAERCDDNITTRESKSGKEVAAKDFEVVIKDDEMQDAEAIFKALRETPRRDKGKSDDNVEIADGPARETVGLCPLLHNIERGVKRMIKHLPARETF